MACFDLFCSPLLSAVCTLPVPSPLLLGVGDDSFCLPNRSSTAATNSGLLPSALALW